MSDSPRFLSVDEVLAIHRLQVSRFGGAGGLRDQTMLESAIGRPINRWNYERSPISELAAAYAYGLARNHPFVDGNKRVAFMAAYVFLGLNGLSFIASEAEVVVMFVALAAGEIDEGSLTEWIGQSTVRVKSPSE